MIDEKLNWKLHLAEMTIRLRAAPITIVRTTAIQIYKALFEFQLRYCILCYGSASQTAIRYFS